MKTIGIIYLGRKGGPTVDTLEMCRTLVKNNRLYIVLSKQIENLEEYIALKKMYPEKIDFMLISTYNTKTEFFFKSLNLLGFIYTAQKIKGKKLDFIYIPMITYWGAIVSILLKGQKIITAVHDPQMHRGEKDVLFEYLSKKCIANSSYLVVFSQRFVDAISHYYSFPKTKICCLKLGGYSYYKKNLVDSGNNMKYGKILFFGRISEYKGIGNLLEATKLLKNQGYAISLRIVGNGNLTTKEKFLISELGDTVELVNRWIKDEEVENFFTDIDFTVLPYIEASQSGVIMLSYAMQKAVLVTDVGALSEQVNSEIGIVIEPGSIEALATGIRKMYENDIFLAMGKKAFYYATQEWTWEKQVKKLLDFID